MVARGIVLRETGRVPGEQEGLVCVATEAVVDAFVTHINATCKPTTRRYYSAVMRSVAPVLRVRFVHEISTEMVNRHLSERVRRLSPVTVNKDRQVLHHFCAFAESHFGARWPNGNPVARTRKLRERQKPIVFLTLDQIDQQLEALAHRPELRIGAALMIYAGLRKSEALWLRWEDVIIGSQTLRIAPKDGWSPKTGHARSVPISGRLAEEVKAAFDLVHQRKGNLPNPFDPPGSASWVVPHRLNQRWDPDAFYEALKRENAKAGLRWRPMDYRHTFGSLLAQKGVSLYKIAAMMGNSPDICRKHYAALTPESLAGEVDFG